MPFRKDINALRAIAVIAVVLFHFNESWLPGGFVGVDVFFVISGYLMTGIIIRGVENERFSISQFYMARASRIIPALSVLCLVLLVFGWFYLAPLDYKALGEHAASSVLFLSNHVYLGESGYFDAASHEKWLLHTWSLSVEWQFYVVYPLMIVLLRKFMSLRAVKVVILIGAVAGFLFCVVATEKSPDSAYYLLPARAWEMLVGGVACLYPFAFHRKRADWLKWSGLTVTAASCFLISEDNHWPGYLAVFPVVGAFLVLQAQSREGAVFDNAVMQSLGAWSYSIYLWHWPLVVALYYFETSELLVYAGIALSVLLGFLSKRYIESIRFERVGAGFVAFFKCMPVRMALLVGLLGGGVYASTGFEAHYPEAVVVANNEAENGNPHGCLDLPELACPIGNADHIKAIVVGDSHADALATAVADAIGVNEGGVIALAESACPFVLNVMSTRKGDECHKANRRRMEYLKAHHEGVPVFWINRTGAYLYGQSDVQLIKDHRDTQPLIHFSTPHDEASEELHAEFRDHLNATIAQLLESHPVYLVQPVPEMRRNVPRAMAKNLLLGDEESDLSIDLDLYLQRHGRVRTLISDVARDHGIAVLDPAPWLCRSGSCVAQLDGRPIYRDGDHLSDFGNRLLSPMFAQAMEQH